METLRSLTLPLLPLAPDVFVSNEAEARAYAALQVNVITPPAPLLTLTDKFRFISTYYPVGTRVLLVEDDIKALKTAVGKKYVKVELDEFAQGLWKHMERTGAKIGGLAPTLNHFFMQGERYTTTLKFAIGYIWAFISDHDQRVVPRCKVKADYERSLRYYVRDGLICRDNHVACVTNELKEAGGLQSDYTFEQRGDRAGKDLEYLFRMFPGMLRINHNRSSQYPEILIKPRKNDGSDLLTLLRLNGSGLWDAGL